MNEPMTKQPAQREAFERWRAAFMEAIDGEHPSAWDAWQAAAARYEGVVEAAREHLDETLAPAFVSNSNGPDVWECQHCLAVVEAKYDPPGRLLPRPRPFVHKANCTFERLRQALAALDGAQ